jgi:ribonuclease E
MSKRMLIDASHPEETRVVVIDAHRVDEFDFEAASKRPLKGNIYLAKVTRVEPSLQAAFVEYGGNRQGFLAFSEIHPDYYQIPVADRQALIAEQQEEARRRGDDEFESVVTGVASSAESLETDDASDDIVDREVAAPDGDEDSPTDEAHVAGDDERHDETHAEGSEIEHLAEEEVGDDIVDQQTITEASDIEATPSDHHASERTEQPHDQAWDVVDQQSAVDHVDPIAHEGPSIPSDREDGAPAQQLRSARPPQRWVRRRHYKIQEVIKRKQIMLVQVVKEERGTKGAALTTYLSLAGRYCVLMPNTPRGGGISRKITNLADRNRLKAAAAALELPEGMGLIIRTAGANRTKLEIKRDYEYLLRMWDQIRELTLRSNAPACVYEEGDIVKRAIRDLYNKDVEEIVVEGDDGYKNAKEFMRMLMPSHAKNVKPYRDPTPLFQRHHIEAQLDAMFQPTVTLKSGGYIVINQTEALVSIDVNSGRATREHSIEETAHKTNLEASDEIGRQLRLRDLAGLIVIDFIDMEDARNDRDVEKRLRDAVKHDRARVQIGKISQFGLLEMSRQRLRAGVVASSTIPCPHCGGQGIVLSVESAALRLLRALDEEGQRGRTAAVNVRVRNDVALYALNQKRRELARIENDYSMTVTFQPDGDLMAGHFELERTVQRAQVSPPKPAISLESVVEASTELSEPVEEESDQEELAPESQQSEVSTEGGSQAPAQSNRKRRRRRRGRGGSSGKPQTMQEPLLHATEVDAGATQATEHTPEATERAPQVEVARPDNGAAGANGQTSSSTSRRRRRRRKKPSNGTQPENHSVAQDESHKSVSGETHSSPAEESALGIIPNAPSEPVWGFGSDRAALMEEKTEEPIGGVYYRREEVSVMESPSKKLQRASEPAHDSDVENVASASGAAEPAPDSPSEPSDTKRSSEPPRRGWWQRAFKQ